MTRAEEKALEAYPEDIQLFVESQEEPGKWLPVDENAQLRYGYKRAYEQAEKDTIDKACKWLEENVVIYPHADNKPICIVNLDTFKKAMEEEQ